jgi:hypothetical protein
MEIEYEIAYVRRSDWGSKREGYRPESMDVEEEGPPKIEYSFYANGRIKEVDITHMATFGLFLEKMECSMVNLW